MPTARIVTARVEDRRQAPDDPAAPWPDLDAGAVTLLGALVDDGRAITVEVPGIVADVEDPAVVAAVQAALDELDPAPTAPVIADTATAGELTPEQRAIRRVPPAILDKARTIVAEGAGGATDWTAGERKIILARLVIAADFLLRQVER